MSMIFVRQFWFVRFMGAESVVRMIGRMLSRVRDIFVSALMHICRVNILCRGRGVFLVHRGRCRRLVMFGGGSGFAARVLRKRLAGQRFESGRKRGRIGMGLGAMS